MPHILRMAAVGIMLGFAATGVAQARPINYHHQQFRAGYAGPMYSAAEPRGADSLGLPTPATVTTAVDIGGAVIAGRSTRAPATGRNDERIND